MYVPYTGVGSRETPEAEMILMQRLAKRFAELGFTLRSGGADGADTAFEQGALAGVGSHEIFLPWKGFNNSQVGIVAPTHKMQKAFELASAVHPAWERLSQAAQKLHSRNCFQLLGENLDSPSEFLVCYTRDGCTGRSNRTSKSGGTATAIVLAEDNGVPVFNMAVPGWMNRLTDLIEELKVKHQIDAPAKAKKVAP